MAIQSFKVKEPAELLAFLSKVLVGQSRNSIKSLLSHKQIFVNGKLTSQFNHPLLVGNDVTIGGKQTVVNQTISHQLKIIFEDESIIVIDKPSGLLTIATEGEKLETAYRILSQHVKQNNDGGTLFILHRLDRDTSGVMMFAKSIEVQHTMQSQWDQVITLRQYQAVVEGQLLPTNGTLIHHLVEGKTGFVHVSKNPSLGQKAITHYETVKSNPQYSLLKLTLDTGRKNQIRVQLAEMGCSVAGDKKYGAKTNPIGRLALHAACLSFIHPTMGKEMTFSSPMPAKMQFLLKSAVR